LSVFIPRRPLSVMTAINRAKYLVSKQQWTALIMGGERIKVRRH